MVRLLTMLILVVGLLLGGHLWIFRFVIDSLALADPTTRMVIFAGLAGLAISFPLAASLVHLRPNQISAAIYVFAATWLGLFLNLLLCIAVAELARWLAELGGWTPRRDLIALAAAATAVVTTAIGAWRARHPELVHREVTLAGLPAAWHGKRVVQLSDLHLGFVNRQRFAERVVALVRAAEPELVVITGDLVDGMGGDVPRLLSVLDDLAAPRGVYFTTGNHEIYSGLADFRSALASTSIHLLDDTLVDLDGLRLFGIAYPGLRGDQGQKLLGQLRAAQKSGGASILLFHTPTDFDQMGDTLADQHFGTYWAPAVGCRSARELGIDLQLSGHTHAGQLFPFNLIARCIFRRRHYGLHRDGDFQIYISSGTGTWGPPLRSGSRSEVAVLTLRPAPPAQ